MPSVEEVNYSVLKSIVPSLKVLDTLAGDLMQPARLATIAMRLYLTEHSLGQSDKECQWRGNVSKKDVIKLSACKDFEEFVTKDSEGYFQSRVHKLLDALKYRENNLNGMPPYVLSTFISKFTDIFLLFLTMKEKACSAEGCSAFMLIGTYGRGISYKDAYESSKGGIHRLIHDLAVKEQILVPPPVKVYADMESVVYDQKKEFPNGCSFWTRHGIQRCTSQPSTMCGDGMKSLPACCFCMHAAGIWETNFKTTIRQLLCGKKTTVPGIMTIFSLRVGLFRGVVTPRANAIPMCLNLLTA